MSKEHDHSANGRGRKNLERTNQKKILEFMESHPEASIKEIAEATNLTPGTIHNHFKKLNITGPKTKVRSIVTDYLEANPDISIIDLSVKLNIPYRTAKHYKKNFSSNPRCERGLVNRSKVRNYVSEHPNATPQEVAAGTELNYTTAYFYLKEIPEYNGFVKKCTRDQVNDYLEEHPNASLTEIMEDVGVSYSTAKRWVKEIIPDSGLIKKKRNREKDTEFIRNYVSLHPRDSIRIIANKLNCSDNHVTLILKECGLPTPKQRLKSDIEAYINCHKDPKDTEIAKALNAEIKTVRQLLHALQQTKCITNAQTRNLLYTRLTENGILETRMPDGSFQPVTEEHELYEPMKRLYELEHRKKKYNINQ